MQIAMTDREADLLRSALARATHYVEFGSGGSTVLAARLVKGSVLSVDSAREWLERVAEHCEQLQPDIHPLLLHVDIGATGHWGFPKDPESRARWPRYHGAVWAQPGAAEADFFLVDGRFRVACAMQVALRMRPDALLAVHDFASRQPYHVLHGPLREVACAGELSLFVRRADMDREQALRILARHAYDPL